VARCAGKPLAESRLVFGQLNFQTTLQTALINRAKEETAMTTRYALFVAAAVVAVLGMQAGSAQALTMTECSAKYKEAKAGNSLNGMKWNDFRKSQCDLEPAKRASAKSAPASTAVASNAVFPSAVDAKYSKEKPGRARRKTCLDQYKANKAGDANGGLKWLQKGGGYYSQCVKKLKGAA
jgi:hypothetical protein